MFNLVREPFDLNETFDLICNTFEPMLRAKQVKLIYTTENGFLPKLIGDGKRFKQVVINLVRNASKFTM